MADKREVVVLSAVRSAVGTFNGALAGMEPAELGGVVFKEAIARSGVDPKQISFATVGNCIPTESRYAYVARVSTIQAGLSMDSVAFAVNRLCGSSQQAIVNSAQAILLGDADFALGGGVEVMSRGAYLMPTLRSGARMGDTQAIDAMVAVLTDPFGVGHMGITAENLAAKHGIGREAQDAFAVESQNRAAKAIAEGRFKSQIAPITLKTRKGDVVFDTDEHPRAGTTMETLAKMKPAFKKDGTVTAGNAAQQNDAAAACLVVAEDRLEALGLTPMAFLVGWAAAGCEPATMGIGPVPAVKRLFARTGLSFDDMALVEVNEAFACQVLSVAKGWGWNDPDRLNVNGSGISLGHPIGATGVRIMTSMLHELRRRGGRYALETMCIGGGQGIAAVVERA